MKLTIIILIYVFLVFPFIFDCEGKSLNSKSDYQVTATLKPPDELEDGEIDNIAEGLKTTLEKNKFKFSENFKLTIQYTYCIANGKQSCKGDIGKLYQTLSSEEQAKMVSIESEIEAILNLYISYFSYDMFEYLDEFFCNFREMNFGCFTPIAIPTANETKEYVFPVVTYYMGIGGAIISIIAVLLMLVVLHLLNEKFLHNFATTYGDEKELEDNNILFSPSWRENSRNFRNSFHWIMNI